MSQRQLQRWHVMKMVKVGKNTLKEASDAPPGQYTKIKASLVEP